MLREETIIGNIIAAIIARLEVETLKQLDMATIGNSATFLIIDTIPLIDFDFKCDHVILIVQIQGATVLAAVIYFLHEINI